MGLMAVGLNVLPKTSQELSEVQQKQALLFRVSTVTYLENRLFC